MASATLGLPTRRIEMPTYLFQAHYATEGVRGVIQEGGTVRRDAVAKLLEASGGRLECFYFAFGDVDVYAIGELPDEQTAAAIAMAINADARVSVATTLLLTPEQVDTAARAAIDYHGPGG
jgi:uncharacterized protein with GYD domain